MKRSGVRLSVVALLLGLLVLVGCGPRQQPVSSGAAQQPPQIRAPLRACYIENASCWPLFCAMEEGYLNKHGVAVELIKAADSTEALNAVIAGHADVSVENTYSILFAIEARSGGKIKLFLPCSETEDNYVSHLLVRKGSGIHSVDQLRGKTIGTYTGATQLLTLKLFLRNYANLDPEKDVKIVQVDQSLQVQAMASKQFDALFTVEPFATIALEKGVAHDLLPFARGKLLTPFPAGACSVAASVLHQKREALRRFYLALLDGTRFIKEQPVKARAHLARHTPLEETIAQKVGGYEYHGFSETTEAVLQQVQRLANMYADAGILPKRIDARSMFIQARDLGL